MTNSNLAIIILAAGHGTRMKSDLPKVLHEIAGRSMLGHVMDSAAALSPARLSLVVGAKAEQVSTAAKALSPDIAIAVQNPPQGTGDAVKQALPALKGFQGTVLVLYADTPLVPPALLSQLVALTDRHAVAVLGFCPDEPGAYGRLKTAKNGTLEAIIEAKDASPDELDIALCNSGVMAFDAAFLQEALPNLSNDNAKGEYYLTDLVAMARTANHTCAVVEAPPEDVLGVNSRLELADAELVFQRRARQTAMENGVTLIDPETTYFSYDTIIENDVIIQPNVFFGPKVSVGRGATIKANSHLEGATIGPQSIIGPFARLRPGTELGERVRIGNFVETKKAILANDVKVNHLSYIGDATIGTNSNIGAGTITCNYDGFNKHQTIIGADAFVGSNSALVAPVSIGDRAYVGSGSVITDPVADDALALGRARQSEHPNWANTFRSKNKS